MMVELLKPDCGTVKIIGNSSTENPLVVKKSISFVPDSPEVYEKLTGNEYLTFMGDVYAVSAELPCRFCLASYVN